MTTCPTIKPDILLDEEALYNAMHSVFSLAYIEEAEEIGRGPKERVVINEWAPRLPKETLLPLAWYLIGRTEQAWGQSVGLVFHHGGIRGAEMQEDALTDLFLGCGGHGCALDDDYSEHIARAEEVLGSLVPVTFDPTPFYDEMEWLHDLARKVLDGGNNEY